MSLPCSDPVAGCSPAREKAGIASAFVTTRQPLPNTNHLAQPRSRLSLIWTSNLRERCISSSDYHGVRKPACAGRRHAQRCDRYAQAMIYDFPDRGQIYANLLDRCFEGRRQPWRFFLVQQVDLHCCAFACRFYSSGIGISLPEAEATSHLRA